MKLLIKFLPILIIFITSCKNNKKIPLPNEPIIATIPININYASISTNEKEKWNHIIETFYNGILGPKLNGQVLVAKNGEILFEKYVGNENVNDSKSKPIDEHTPIHLASCSKTFTAGAILLLQQQNKLSIDDLVTKYLPEFPYSTITLKMLLNHRSGILNYVHNLENWGWKSDSMATNMDIYKMLVLNKPVLNYPSDTHFSYCNTNYALLALIVEKISGKTFPEWMKKNIFLPLQMNDTYVFQPKDTATATMSYEWNNRPIAFMNLDAIYGDKNIYSTVRDMYKWDQALYTNALLTEESKTLAYTPYSNERPGIKNYGLGWRMFNFPNQKKIVFHNGWWHGNNNAFIRLIQDSATIICLGNKFSRANYGVMQLTYLFGDYPFEYEVEEGKDTAQNNEMLMMQQLKLRADSLKNVKKLPLKKDTAVLKKDTTKMLKPKDTLRLKDTLKKN
jgi:CubicO group peptidase (beta-lactamase class C family)